MSIRHFRYGPVPTVGGCKRDAPKPRSTGASTKRAPAVTTPCSAVALRAGRCSAISRSCRAICCCCPIRWCPISTRSPRSGARSSCSTCRGSAMRWCAASAPVRVNYAIFGNVEPALHAHVIPRYRSEPEAHAHPASVDVRLERGAGLRSRGGRAADAARCARSSRSSARCEHPDMTVQAAVPRLHPRATRGARQR